MNRKHWIQILTAIAAVLMLSACGGGGGSSGGDGVTGSNWDQMKWDQGTWQ